MSYMSDNSRTSPRLIKKYPNRRLYDTHTSAHVTLADIRQFVIDDIPFQVVDARTGEDLTRAILMQIIQEAESQGEPIFFKRYAQEHHPFLWSLSGDARQLPGQEHSNGNRRSGSGRCAIVTGLE
ncbi:polyhydroxyalkanoate synthesis regulator DNA-binding domain-containing protein [Pseudomonas asuensis]